jgi:uncharacterized protein YdaU (DUF1376 family)
MSQRPDLWMPLYIGDYLSDTMHLSRDEHGAYMLLLMAYWRNGGPLADDDSRLRHVCKASTKEWAKLRPVLAPFFTIADGLWTQKRAQEELDAAAANVERQAARTRAATEAKAAKHRNGQRNDERNDKPNSNVTTSPLPLPSPVVTPSYPSGTPSPAEPTLGLPVLPEGFEPDHRSPVEGAVKRAKRAIPLPDDWELPNDWREFGARSRRQQGMQEINLDAEAQRFKYHHLAKGSVFKNWKAAWRNWVTSNFAGGGVAQTGSKIDARKPTQREAREADLRALYEATDHARRDRGDPGKVGIALSEAERLERRGAPGFVGAIPRGPNELPGEHRGEGVRAMETITGQVVPFGGRVVGRMPEGSG